MAQAHDLDLLIKKVDALAPIVEKMATQGRSKATVGGQQMFDTLGFGHNWQQNPWPEKLLNRLTKSYSSDVAAKLMQLDNRGRPRVQGFGPAFTKMAVLNFPDRLRSFAPQLPEGYNNEQFEKDEGFVEIGKAARHGITGSDGIIRKTALAENSGLAGGYIVPPQFITELQTIAAEDAFIEPRCKVIPMTSRTMQLPMLDITTAPATGTTPYYGGILGQWQPEAASINETEPQFKQTEWTAWDLVLYTVSSNQLLADNGIGLDALLTQLFAGAMTWYKEWAFINGVGAGSKMPLGILNAPATLAVTKTTAGKFLFADAATMLSKLQIRSWKDACWVMHQSVLPQLIQMFASTTSGDQRLVFLSMTGNGSQGAAAGNIPMTLFGLPIFWTEKAPQIASGTLGAVSLVDWSRYVIGNRLDIQIDVSGHLLFRTNQLAWRVIVRCDGRPWLNNAITDAQGYTISPFVTLQD
jgi:HK97 family phage major capsid protein